jgi:hypothetical protein
MAKLPQGDRSTSELHSDAWERFERAVDAAIKSGPKHRMKGKKSPKKKKKAGSK